MFKTSTLQPAAEHTVILAERELVVARGGWVGGAGLGVAGPSLPAPAGGQAHSDAMDAYIKQ